VLLLSHVRQGYGALGKAISGARRNRSASGYSRCLEGEGFRVGANLEKVNEAFRLIGEKPVTLSGRLEDVLVEDFRKELSEIQSPEAKRLFVLATANRMIHLRIGEYVALGSGR